MKGLIQMQQGENWDEVNRFVFCRNYLFESRILELGCNTSQIFTFKKPFSRILTVIKIYLGYCNSTRTHNQLVRKRTLNHSTKLAKW